MKSSVKAGFTLVELLIGVVMMSIVIAGIAFTVGSGFDLFTKVDSNAVVISGVRFTADSFKRTVSPMLNVTSEIEILPAASAIPAPASISDDIHYVFLSNNSVVHRDSQGDHELEGSEYIDNIEFSIPVSSADIQENYLLKMDLHGKNNVNPNANLDLEIVSALYNRPEKIGTAVSGNYSGGVLKIRASLYLDMLDLYDDDTKVRINGSTKDKGTKIEAVYDLINQTGTSVPMSDDSTVEWFISGSVSADLPITEIIPDENNKNSYCWQLVLPGGNPLTGRVLNTTGTFHLKTGVTATDREVGVIRCRVTPVVTSGRDVIVTGIPKWSDYVVIKAVEAPAGLFQKVLDVLVGGDPNGTDDVFYTDYVKKTEDVFTVLEDGSMSIKSIKQSNDEDGALFVMQLKYDKFDNDRIYAAWTAGRETQEDIPSYMTVTNYSVILDSKIASNNNASKLFLSTRPDEEKFGEIDKSKVENKFEDMGYAVQYMPYIKPSGFLVSKYDKGEESKKETEINNEDVNVPQPFGIYNETLDKPLLHYYKPESLNNSKFAFDDKWTDRYRVLYTVLEYYVKDEERPHFIFRVRFLKRTDNWKGDEPLSDIKKTDPWCIGPKFYASEPMWFGDFVGNSPTKDSDKKTTYVNVKNYDGVGSPAKLNRQMKEKKSFYALNRRPSTGSLGDVFRSRAMEMKETKSLAESRYIGLRGINEANKVSEALTVYDLDFAPGFSINEIRSIMPKNGKLYSLKETIPASELLKIQDKDWYKSYEEIISTSKKDINEKVFGTSGKSDGFGDNGSWYYQNAGSEGGIYDLQHIRGTCNCPLHNELFKWFGGK